VNKSDNFTVLVNDYQPCTHGSQKLFIWHIVIIELLRVWLNGKCFSQLAQRQRPHSKRYPKEDLFSQTLFVVTLVLDPRHCLLISGIQILRERI
jgi:hypothetical protein